MADSALTCFENLLATVPEWFTDLESILAASKSFEAEVAAAVAEPAPQPAQPFLTALPTENPLTSVYPRSRGSRQQALQPSKQAVKDFFQSRKIFSWNSKHLLDITAIRQAPKQPVNSSACSTLDSDVSRPRPRRVTSNLQYNGEVQIRFEKLVRAVGGYRNGLRKAKMTVKVEALSRTGSSSGRDLDTDDERDDLSPNTATLPHKSSRDLPPASPRLFKPQDDSRVFDEMDARLEKAQALCERAAHQILRDGDCTLDVQHARTLLAEAQQIAEDDIPRLRTCIARNAQRQQRLAERKRKAEEEAAAKAAAAEQKRISDTELRRLALHAMKPSVPRPTMPFDVTATLLTPLSALDATGPLEADDADDEDDMDFNVSSMQFSKCLPARIPMRSIAFPTTTC